MSMCQRIAGIASAIGVAGFGALLGYQSIAGGAQPDGVAWTIAVVALALLGGSTFWLARRMLNPIAGLRDALDALNRDGDLSVRAPEGAGDAGEIAAAFNQFVTRQQHALREAQREMEALAISLHELTALTGQMAKDTRTQSDFAAASAATVEEITVSINHIAEHANDVDTTVADTSRQSADSAQAVERVTEEVGHVATAMTSLGATMNGLSKSSQEIGSIIGVIRDIADQTNLLALNAAIEAARAGEAGRGFAVVADEVRKLAERTGQATVEIAKRIETVGKETQSAVDNMAYTSQRVGQSVERAGEARTHMLQIAEQMNHVVDVVREIADATREQSSATTTMAQSAEQINSMAQATDSALHNASQSLTALDERAAKVLEIVGRFQLADIEVQHGWMASSEARAVSEIKALLNAQGHHWKDASGGANPTETLQRRISQGDAPTAAAIGGVKIQNWARDGVCADLTGVARDERWSSSLPAVFDAMIQHDGRYVAVPLGVARTNMLWVNAGIVKRLGLTAPRTWNDFFAMADKLKAAGIPALAHSEQSWQVGTVFEAVALGTGGTPFYLSAFSKLDPSALTGSQMITALETLKRLKSYITPDSVGRDWNLATADVMNGRAAMQLMGDWAKSEFTQGGKVQGTDYLCWPAPTNSGDWCFAADTLTMFRQTDPRRAAAQRDFVSLLMSREGQEAFNFHKGNIPARTDVDLGRFDDYSRQSARDFASAAQSGVLVPSWAHNMAMQDNVRLGFFDVIEAYWKDDRMTAADAARRLADAARR
ncbi:extracellular solute-binding protein [Jeongeupia naejangsanensis]|uniref:Extracellular solute-binding protein n=1 Tax=Jeongeupia naejangsanensis TaxID=613195 RepID=A0ABS2BSH1_9NEIS|nr:extracellular solute-binding protein [Jeongeupia naejangsanensis]MBM3117769.1 extracellular solute-binding protein [Jeongeupia naejangsanensis]